MNFTSLQYKIIGHLSKISLFSHKTLDIQVDCFDLNMKYTSANVLGQYVPGRVVFPVGGVMTHKTLVVPVSQLGQFTHHLRPYC